MIDYALMARLGVATIYDTYGKRGLIDLALHASIAGSRVAGPARTVLCAQDDNLMVHAAIERIEPGDVVVIAMPQPHAIAVVGDLLATQIARRGAAAVLTPAAVRDLDALRELGLPVWSQFVRAKSCEKKTPGALDVSLTFGGTTIQPGDAIVLDDDGACAVAAADVERLIERAREKTQREDSLRAAIARGELTLDLNDLRRLLPGGPPVGGD